jgi:hypothetical protein
MNGEKVNRRISSLHPTVKAAGWVSLFTDVSSDMIVPLLPLFLKSVLMSGMTFIIVIEGAAETTASLFKLFSGYISDRLGRRKVLVLIGYTLSSITRPLMAATQAAWHVLSLRMADRVGKGIRTSPRDALVADCSPAEIRGLAMDGPPLAGLPDGSGPGRACRLACPLHPRSLDSSGRPWSRGRLSCPYSGSRSPARRGARFMSAAQREATEINSRHPLLK